MDLIKDTEVAAILSVAVDARITAVTKAVNVEAFRGTGRTFERKQRTVVVRGYGLDYTWLPEAPIISIDEVRIDSSGEFAADSIVSDLTLFAFAGAADPSYETDFRLFYRGGTWPEGARVARVKCTAGYYAADETDPLKIPRVPEDLRQEMILEAAQRVRSGAGEKHKSASLGDFSYTNYEKSESDFRRIVRRYRRPA